MKKNAKITLAIALALICQPKRADAVLGVADTAIVEAPAVEILLGAEIKQLSTLIGMKYREMADVAATLTNIVALLRTANQMASIARKTKHAYETISNYSLDDLKNSALSGLMDAFPEIGEIYEESKMLSKNVKSAQDGSFWSQRTKHDRLMEKLLTGSARIAFRSSIYPMMYKWAGLKKKDPTESELLVQRYFQAGKDGFRLAVKAAARSTLTNRLEKLVNDAEMKEQLDQKLAGVTAQATTGTLDNTEFLRNAKEREIADMMKKQMARDASDKMTREALSEDAGDITEIGVIK